MEKPTCPKCNCQNFEIWKLPKLYLLHWILNPGLAIFEVVLGMRVPKQLYVCNQCQRHLVERAYVYCSVCSTLHSSLIWSKRNALGHWFGYVCPKCSAIIPCLWNITSLLVIGITLPIWWFPARFYRHKWLDFEKERLTTSQQNLKHQNVSEQIKQINWISRGIIGFGLPMWLVFSSIIFLILPSTPRFAGYSYGKAAIEFLPYFIGGLPLCLLVGAIWGLLMRKRLTKDNFEAK
ncbi:MAG: hypothetical protein WAQ98_00525 [Blastocatellia bacterium]